MPPKKKTEKVERYGTKISGDGPVAKAKGDLTADTKTPEQVKAEPKAKKDD